MAISASWPIWLQKLWHLFLKITKWFFILSILTVIVYRFIPPPFTPLMVQRMIEQKMNGKEAKCNKDWVSLEEISKSLPRAVIASEDQNFENHFGLDFNAIAGAKKYNEKHKGNKVIGASTITQQTAKNVFLTQSRTYIRKAFEVYFTFLIEIFWSKKRIMEVYLNEIEMGNGIYGVEAASQYYFKKPAAKLSNSEAAAIAAILPNPLKRSASKPDKYTAKRKRWILKQMNNLNYSDF
jgi:monofunctional glycosyltransferase